MNYTDRVNMINKLMIFTLLLLANCSLFTTNTFAFNEKKDQSIESLLTRIEVNTFIAQISKIKKFN